jgi:hypothetical protein
MMRELTPSHDVESGEGVATSRSAPPQAARNCGDNSLDRQLRRYAGRLRPHLRRMANESKAHADLLFSFPAASVAIATARPRGNRLRAFRLIGSGAKLAEIADVLLLPMWTRRLPPEAFDGPLPSGLYERAGDAAFGSRVLNMLPAAGAGMSTWLRWVLEGRSACDDEFALWIASLRVFDGNHLHTRLMLPLALFAWFSRRPSLEAAKLMRQPWTDKMSLAKAAWETQAWLLRVLQDLCVEGENTWTSELVVNGLAFVPLTTPSMLREEALHMGNCLASYSEHTMFGTCRLYSIRREGVRLADMAIRLAGEAAQPFIASLLGPKNAKHVPKSVRDAANVWFTAQSRERWPFRWGTLGDETFQRFIWGPYASARPRPGHSPPPVSRALRDAVNLYIMAEADRARRRKSAPVRPDGGGASAISHAPPAPSPTSAPSPAPGCRTPGARRESR